MAQFHSHCQIFPIFPGALTSRHEAEHPSFLSFVLVLDNFGGRHRQPGRARFSCGLQRELRRTLGALCLCGECRSPFGVWSSGFAVHRWAGAAARSHIAAHFPENSFASLINRPPPRAREAIKPDSVSLGWWE